MKLHLPKMLAIALMAACSASWAAIGDTVTPYTAPSFGGTERTWTGAGGNTTATNAQNWDPNGEPRRADNKGAVYVFDGADVMLTGVNGGIDSSDFGGIKAVNNSNVVANSLLGRWAGAIYVEAGSVLTTSYSTSLKNTEASTAANVYVDGVLNLTGSNNMNMDDGNNYQNWHIGKDGIINVTNTDGTVTKGNRTWNLEFVVDDTLLTPEGVAGRGEARLTEQTKTVLTSDNAIALDNVGAYRVINTSNKLLGDNTTTETVNAAVLSLDGNNWVVHYYAAAYEAATLTWNGGEEGQWKATGHGWLLNDTDATFINNNGDSVVFGVAGTREVSINGALNADAMTVQAAGYSLNSAAEGASLTVQTLTLEQGATLTNNADVTIAGTMSGTKDMGALVNNGHLAVSLTGGDANILNISSDSGSDGVLEVKAGAIHYRSEIGDNTLRLAGGSKLIFGENAGSLDAPDFTNNIELAGNATVQVWGSSKHSSVTISGDVTGAYTLTKTDGNQNLIFSGIVNIGGLTTDSGGGGTIIFNGGEGSLGAIETKTSVSIRFSAKDGARNEYSFDTFAMAPGSDATRWLIVDKDVTVNGTGSSLSTEHATIMNSWGVNNGGLEVNGTLNTVGVIGMDSGSNTSYIKGTGVINTKGLDLCNGNTTYIQDGITINITSDTGIYRRNTGNGSAIHLLDATLKATDADWTFKTGGSNYTVTLESTDTGTSFAAAAGRTITLAKEMGGEGKLVKAGDGTVVISAENSYSGGTSVTAGTLKVAHAAGLGTAGTVAVSGGTLQIAAEVNLGNRVTQDGDSAISVTEAGNLTLGASTINAAITNAGTVALSNTIADAIAADAGSGDYIYMGLNGVETTETGNYFLGTQATTVTIVTGEGTATGTVSYNDKVYTLAENGKITTEDTAVDYTTFFMQTDSLAVTAIAAESSAHDATLDTVEVNGGTLSVDANVANVVANGGTVSIAEGSSVTGILEVAENATVNGAIDAGKVTIDAGKTATMTDGVSTSGVTIGGTAGATVQNTGSEDAAYSLTDANAKVTAENLTASSAQAVAVNNKLVVDSIVNEGTGTLTVTGMEGNLTDLVAKDGSITLQNVEQPLQVSNLSLGAEHAVSIYTGADAQTEGAIKVTGNLTSAAGSDLYANLLIGDGATLTLNNDALTLHSQITVEGKFTVAGTKAQDISSLAEGSTLTFIDGTALTYAVDYNGQDAASYLTNVQAGQYEMVANGTTFGIKKTGSSPVVPEPTTGTLSLLALAGLMARRRRK